MANILGIIPARYDSQRLKGKVLMDIGGKSMLRRVYEQAQKCPDLAKVVVATDHAEVFEEVKSFGGEVMMTSDQHKNGTDRCAEVAKHFQSQFPIVINIQGDEPFIDPAQISDLAALFEDENTQIGTLVKKINHYEELIDEKEAKVVLNVHHEAIYMSRSPIPYLRGVEISQWVEKADYYKHIGIYGFRSEVLRNISELPPTLLEQQESLEQLRWMAYYKIKVGITQFETIAVDTQADLEIIQEFLKKNPGLH